MNLRSQGKSHWAYLEGNIRKYPTLLPTCWTSWSTDPLWTMRILILLFIVKRRNEPVKTHLTNVVMIYLGWIQWYDSNSHMFQSEFQFQSRCIIDLRLLESFFWWQKFSHSSNQETTEGGVAVSCPDMRTCRQAHAHPVPFLQLQENCISSSISWVIAGSWISWSNNHVVILAQYQPWWVFSFSSVEEVEIINTINRCNKVTCRNKRIFIKFKGFWSDVTILRIITSN